MARKLVIENIVKVPVKFTMSNNGKPTVFAFSVTCNRLDEVEVNAKLNGELTFKDFVTEVIIGWEGQKLVVEEDGTPAEFDSESLEILLAAGGVATVIFNAYLKEIRAKEKN